MKQIKPLSNIELLEFLKANNKLKTNELMKAQIMIQELQEKIKNQNIKDVNL